MRLKSLLIPLVVLLLVGVTHIWLNVGFERFGRGVRNFFGAERQTLVVGFLPVT